ncbi:MAG: hypothetical protein RDU14_03335 [Melioribacteraceae bacterium]|nr:hypothetical protein [Melioribacteraceae bacterium]
MNLSSKIKNISMDWADVALLKVAVFAATLLVAKLWNPLLSLDWYWYFILWIVAAIKPLYAFFGNK